MKQLRKTAYKTRRQAAFSLVEIMVVVGILGIMVGMGSVMYFRQINESKVASAAQMIDAKLKQTRQMAIAMRQSRRLVINTDDPGNGMKIWVEGKRSEGSKVEPKFYEDQASRYFDQKEPNKYVIGDEDKITEDVAIADVAGFEPNGNVYIEFNARGQVAKVYFSGEEQDNSANNKQPIIHLSRVNEVFEIDGERVSYEDGAGGEFADLTWEHDDANERYKVHTLEVVRLTGRTRKYDYGIFAPWPTDQKVD